MKRSPLQTLTLQGSPTDIAYALGQNRRFKIKTRVAFWNKFIADTFKDKKLELYRLEKSFFQAAVKQAPHYLAEIYAMAEGAGVAIEDLFRLNLTELVPFAEKCSTVIIPFYHQGKQHTLLAHNEDWNPKRNDVFILNAKLPNVSYTIVAYDGYLPGLSCGMNSHELIHAINYTRPHDFKVGLPRIFVTRHLVTARDFNDVIQWCKKTNRAFGQSIHMVKGARYVNLELSAKLVVKREPKLPTMHTNHYIDKRLARLAPPGANSQIRLLAGERILAGAESWIMRNADANANMGINVGASTGTACRAPTKISARKLAIKILSDRSTWPHAIWRDGDSPDEESATLVTAVYDTQTLTPEFMRRPK